MEKIIKCLLDEFQEDEMLFSDMRSPYREISKRISSDFLDDPVKTRVFLTTMDAIQSSLI